MVLHDRSSSVGGVEQHPGDGAPFPLGGCRGPGPCSRSGGCPAAPGGGPAPIALRSAWSRALTGPLPLGGGDDPLPPAVSSLMVASVVTSPSACLLDDDPEALQAGRTPAAKARRPPRRQAARTRRRPPRSGSRPLPPSRLERLRARRRPCRRPGRGRESLGPPWPTVDRPAISGHPTNPGQVADGRSGAMCS